jgi:hypothetical protein
MQQEVIPMSVTTLFNSENNNNKRPVRSTWSGIQATAAVSVALLIAAFFVAVGCSKKSSQSSIKSENQNPSMTAYNSAPSAPVVNEATSAPVNPIPKKSARKRPVNVTYSDKANGISFRYPRKYTLKSGDELQKDLAGLGPVGMSFVQPGGKPLVAVEMPEGSYPDTDFRSAYFDISANAKLSPEQCSQFSVANTTAGDSNNIEPTRVKIGDAEFDVVEDFTGQVMKQSDAKYYHTYQDGVCYEFALGLGTSGAGVEDQITPVDRDNVFHKLERILATVKISGMSEEAKAALLQPAAEPAKTAEEQKPVNPISAPAEQTAKAGDQMIKSDAAPKQ